MRDRRVARRVMGSLGVWVLVLALLRVVVLLPEHCPAVDTAAARRSVEEAIGWFERNQAPDGTWLYRYDRDQGRVVPGYNVVRHAGVTMSLYQAAEAGFDDAGRLADGGTEFALENLVRHDGWAAFEPSSTRVTTGATALLVAGLAERRRHTGDERYDEAMVDLAEFLVAQTEPSGAVLESWDRTTESASAGRYSPFFTGEAFWALTLMHEQFPDGGWREPAERIGDYLATRRDAAEDREPDVPDHWAAYGFAVVVDGWDERLDDDTLDYVRRQAGFGGVQARYESQRVDSFPRWLLRGRRTLGAGLGTVGEQLGALSRVATTEPDLADLREPIADRSRCVAGMLVDRQVSADEAAHHDEPGRVRGAWFQFDVTQMDDQQHALSALLLALPLLEEDRRA